jgi:hypothetical protein
MKPQAATVRLPLLQALSKYENLGNQLITEERIKIKSQQEPVRPSLLYWIKYYRDELGIGHHDSVQRGNFLFRSENGRRLSPEERERVNLVLKSVEENFPLEIDTVQGNIIFPVFQAPKPSVQLQRMAQPAPAPTSMPAPLPRPVEQPIVPDDKSAFSFGGLRFGASETSPNPGALSFSSKHVFPGEKAMPQPLAKPVSQSVPPQAPVRPAVPAPGPKSSPFRIRPVSLGKEE